VQEGLKREINFGDDAHETLYDLEAGSFWFRARNRLLLWAIEKYFGEGAGKYLELGCGTGFVLAAIEERFPALDIYGSEAMGQGLELARKRVKRATLVQLDARELPYDNEFDLVGIFDVLEHISEDALVLAEIQRSLKPKGLVVLTVPQHPFLWGPADEAACHVRRYTAPELRAKFEAAGFEVLRLTSFVSTLLPMMMASRLQQRLRPRAFHPQMEFKMSRAMDRLLEVAMDVERACIQRGLDFPAGGSLLVVARKR
jgi:ubiquinone/menaquinone biosynthesis C-methylase UbiE